MQLFFSYGHDYNSIIVERLKNDLEKEGYKVWIDFDKIKAGNDWRRKITTGILESDMVFSFASKHSLRNPGVCLDELSIAVCVKGAQVQSILLETNVMPPSNLSHRQYIDMSSWKQHMEQGDFEDWYALNYKEVLSVINSPETKKYADEIEYLRKKLKPELLTVKKDNLAQQMYCGREWLVEKIKEWVHSDSKVLLLKGGPGTGKSSFVAHEFLFNDAVVAAIYCEWNNPFMNNYESISRTLIFQLSTKLPDYRAQVIEILKGMEEYGTQNVNGILGQDIFKCLLVRPLQQLIDGNRSTNLILIDGMDEIENDKNVGIRKVNQLAEMIGREISNFPRWIKFVLTSRPDMSVYKPLSDVHRIDIDTYKVFNYSDVQEYIKKRVETRYQEKNIEKICEKCNGNFLYAKLLCDYICSNKISILDINKLMPNIGSFYLQNFDRTFKNIEDFDKSYYPVLCMLAVSPEPVPITTIKNGMHWGQRQYLKFLKQVSHLLNTDEEKLSFFHKSLKDWIMSEDADEYVVEPVTGYNVLAKSCIHTYLHDKTSLNDYEYSYTVSFLRKSDIVEKKRYLKQILEDDKYADALLEKAEENIIKFRYLTAEMLVNQAIDIYKNCKGKPGTDNKLGRAFCTLATINDLDVELEKCIEICKNGLSVLNELYEKRYCQDIINYIAALYYQKALSERRLSGEENWDIADSDYDKACQLYTKIHDDGNLMKVLNDKALTYRVRGRMHDSLTCYEQIKNNPLYLRLKKENTSLYLIINMNYAWCLRDSGKSELAGKVLDECASIYFNNKINLPPKDIAQLFYIISLYKYGIADYNASLNSAKQALVHVKKAYGERAVEICSALNQIGNSLMNLKKYNEAKEYFKKSCEIRLKFYGEKNIYTAISMRNLANTYLEIDTEETIKNASELFEKVHEIKLELFNDADNQSVVAQSWLDLGRVEEAKQNLHDALIKYKFAEEIYLRYKVDIDMAICYLCLGRILSKLKKIKEAKNYLVLGEKLFIKVGYTNQHPFRIEIKNLLDKLQN